MFEPTKEFYLANQGKKFKVGRTSQAEVSKVETESRGGTWATGFRFYRSEWALLKRVRKTSRIEYSMDHGKTWHSTIFLAKKSKGKLKLSSSNHGEFAFHGIQQICREYEGPNYRWKR